MIFTAALVGLVVALFVGMLLCLELGRRLGRRSLADESGRTGVGATEGALFALLGLLVAFAFSGALGRFDARRELIVAEANAISTAWSRVDLLPASAAPNIRAAFRRYLDSRLAAYAKLPDVDAAVAELETSAAIQDEIWSLSVAALEAPGMEPVRMLVLPPQNEMFDIATSRTLATRAHSPLVVFVMLVLVALGSALLAGHAMAAAKQRSWLHVIAFPAAIAIVIYVIIDLEYPRLGLIRVDDFDRALIDLRATMD